MILRDWSVVTKNPYDLVEKHYLQGRVYGHPRFEDGTLVTTSRIEEIRVEGDYKEVTTRSGSIYYLHKNDVSVEYEKSYPNAYERLGFVEG